jgi:hypothetical protein
MQLASKLRNLNLGTLATIGFFGIAGIILLIMLPLNGYPPHIGLMGIISLIAAYGLLQKRGWSIWLIAALFLVANTFSIYTLFFVAGTDALATVTMLTYVILTWVFTVYAVATRKAILTQI